jgi:hypothetical protein
VTLIDTSRPAVHAATPDEMPILAAALGDSPETVISHHLLTTRACNAWCVGDVRQPRAIVVQAHAFPAEPTMFGESADDIARIIPFVRDWTTFCVPAAHARGLERPIANAVRTGALSTLEDVYHVLDGELPDIEPNPDVRLLTADDAELLAGMPVHAEIANDGAIIAAAILEGEVVSLAHTFAWSPLYVDIGVTTHEDWRNHGYATSAAFLVTREIRTRGRTPVWSCGSHNEPSLRVAARLGFRETSRRVYIIPAIPERQTT